MVPATVLQPDYFDAFHCIGAACEDTCCIGWIVHVDKATYEKYQRCSDPDLGSRFRELVQINGNNGNPEDFGRIAPHASGCPFLTQGLCSIQAKFGEDHLSNMCATYPRVVNKAGGLVQASLDLSCPEAARLALLNPDPMTFREGVNSLRPGEYPSLDQPAYREIKTQVIAILQDRSRPVGERLFLAGAVCGDVETAGLRRLPAQPGAQLELAVELMLARMTGESNPRRFLECYQQFIEGLGWTSTSTAEELEAAYMNAYCKYYAPLLSEHEYILERWLTNYVHRTLFPFGLESSNNRLRDNRVSSSIAAQYMLLVAQFAIVKTLLIGMAGFHKSAFSLDHVLKAIQSCAKTFEHSLVFPGKVIEILAERGMTTPQSLSVLLRN